MLSVSTPAVAQTPDVITCTGQSPRLCRPHIQSDRSENKGRSLSPSSRGIKQNDIITSPFTKADINKQDAFSGDILDCSDGINKLRKPAQNCASKAFTVPSIRVEALCDHNTTSYASPFSKQDIMPFSGNETLFSRLEMHDSDMPAKVMGGILDCSPPRATAECPRTADVPVSLPCRYRLDNTGQNGVPHETAAQTVNSDDLDTRERDLGEALKWIRQEILHMKEQDKSLLKQFIELRASILQLRCLYDMHGSCSDVSSLDGSTFSLNEQAKSPRLRRIVLESDMFLKPSISLPNSPRVARFKWKSDEFL
ncbi:uncharacterized protein LOC106012228 [Aplysia californica]|uniref:Uncharacterized protein LOC106012228 n=1 Tax=Aplysia californica TaxID=6500 RepID=A0ABM1A3A5_APLCA|nr:uncharacterized protein LOC106012228 [Aplysia californica]